MAKTTRRPLPKTVMTEEEFNTIRERYKSYKQFLPGGGWLARYKDYNHYVRVMHADHRSGTVKAPGWFRRMYNRFSRHQQEMALRKAISADLDNFSLPLRKRNINWEWF